VAVDSAGNVHVVWSDTREGGAREIYYKMVKYDFSEILIDDTMITADDSEDSVRPVLAIDSLDRIFVVWHDMRVLGGPAQVFLARLEPGLDDQNGDAADPAVIKTLSDLQVSSTAGKTPRLAIDASNNLHIVWEDEDTGEIKYRKLDDNGGPLVAEKALSGLAEFHRSVPDLALESGDTVHVTWNQWEEDLAPPSSMVSKFTTPCSTIWATRSLTPPR